MMARMIPATIHPDVKSAAEKRIFRLLRDAPGTDDWVVLHSLGLARHQTKRRGEIDFVVLCPRGVFVLEVKGGRVSREQGVWKTLDRYGQQRTLGESPYDQAASAMFSLEKDIVSRLGKGHLLANVLFGYGVLFPNTPPIDSGTNGDSDITYSLEDTHYPVTRFIGRLAAFTEQRSSGTRRRLTPGDISGLTDFLRGDFDLIPPLWIKVRETEEELLELTKEQYLVLDALETNPRLIVRGAAGTGKTVLARRAALTSARTGKRVLLLCYNRLLASRLKMSLAAEPSAESLDTYSVYQLMDELISNSSFRDEFRMRRNDCNQDSLYSSLYPEYASLALLESEYGNWDIIVVDEGQDFVGDPVLDFLDLCLKGGFETGNWRWFMDDNNQAAVYGRCDLEGIRRLERFGISQILTVNCRNTVQIHEETRMLTNPRVQSVARVEGPPVRYAWYRSTADQPAVLARQLRRILGDGVLSADVVILSARALTDCAAGSLSSDLVTPLDESTLDRTGRDQRVAYATISAFKGLEAEVVILTDVEQLDGRWWSSVLYVGMSRARVELVVLLPEKLRSNYNQKVRAALASLENEE